MDRLIIARGRKTRSLGRRFWPGFVALVLAPIGVVNALSVRVDCTGGAPRLLVDGKPVRARMFFGIPGSAPLAVAAGPRQVTFDFTARDSADAATMHFRFGNKAGSVDLDDIHVVDLDDGREVMPRCDFEDGPASLTRAWTAWPPGEKNTVGRVEAKAGAGQSGSAAMHVELRAPANGQWPDFHIYHHANLRLTRGHRHRVTFWVSARPGRELTVGFYRPGATYVHLGGPPGPFESQITMAAGAGVNFVSFPIDLPWPKPGQPAEWTAVDLACQQVLAANPRALLLPRMGMTPPDWWQQEHRDDVMQWENGRRGLAVVASPGYRRDPARERALIDWAEFQQEAMSRCVCDLAHAVREASGGRKLVVFFYGYLFEFAAAPNGPPVSGHYALRRVLDSPDIDILCSPISYFDRGLGQGAPSMTAAESVALAGKMWLNEDDTRTYLGTGDFPGAIDAVSTLEDTNRELVRNVGQEAIRNFGTWWMDLGATGWFNDPRMWREMARLKAIDEPLLEHPSAFRPEVAAVIDERAMLRLAAGSTVVTGPGVYEVRAQLGRMGAPYGQYLLDDVLAGRVHARLFIMLNAWRLSAQERTTLAERLRGSTVIWCYAPGYFDGDQPSSEAMQQLSGFPLAPCSTGKALATPTEAGMRLGLRQSFGPGQPVRPLFSAGGVTPEQVLASYPDGSAAVAIRRDRDGARIFVGVPGLTSDLLRAAAREAGVHLFTETDCNVYSWDSFLVLHASKDGPILVALPARPGQPGRETSWRITDALTGEPVGRGSKVRLTMKRGDTRILRYE